jgi:adenosylhomocysteine nucleosidase
VTILAATGLRREARIIEGPGVAVVAGAGRAEALEAALLSAAAGVEALISIGIGGALGPGLQPGDWVVATSVIADGSQTPTDPAWTAEIRARLPAARMGPILGSDVMLTQAAEKRAAHQRWQALAVDMESHVAARVARRLGLPFAAVRVISDSADRDLPAAVTVGMKPDGGMALGAVLWALARDPAQLPALIRTGRDAERAFRALADGRRLLGPGVGRPDFVQLPLDVG